MSSTRRTRCSRGIYKRFDGFGAYDESSGAAQTAHRVRKLIGPAPVLLLTATPIQNSLAELWGLLHYVEPTGTLVGSLPTFKALFCAGQDGRRLVPEQVPELRRRLAEVVQRTLRRQAQEFLDKPFVGRRAELYEYSMSPEEKQLYDDVTNYLLVPQPQRVPGSFTATVADRVSSDHGILHRGVGEESGTGGRPTAANASGVS